MSDPLAKFGRWCLTEMRESGGCDINGFDSQDEAIRLGLLYYVWADKPCGELCWCETYYCAADWPVQCLRETPLAKIVEEKL